MDPDTFAEELAKEAIKAGVGSAVKEAFGKIDNLFGSLFPYFGTKKLAIDTYIKGIQESDLSPEHKAVAIYNAKKTIRELKNQAAIVGHAYNAAKPGTDFSESSAVDDDWLARFLDAGGFVSDEEVQVLWGNVLAGEFEHPGSAPLSLIRILSEMSKKHAETFMTLCSMNLSFISTNSDGWPLVASKMLFVPSYEYLPECPGVELTLQSLTELEALGLIKTDALFGYIHTLDPNYDALYLLCGDTTLHVDGIKDKSSVSTGMVTLTAAGKFLQQFTSTDPPAGYADSVMRYLSGHSKLSVKISHTVAFKRVLQGEEFAISPIRPAQVD